MKIKRILNPVAQENTYILENESASLVIDPGSNTSSILAKLEAIAKPVAAILLTHTHYDHIMSVEAVRQAYNHPPVYVAEAEKDWLMNPVHNLSGLPRHDDMEDVIVNPADYYFDLTTIVFLQATDGTLLSVTKKSLTHIFHKKKSPSLLFSFWQSWAF